jgi:hypothetical protein
MDGKVDLQQFLAAHKQRIQKLSNKRLYTPKEEPYMEGHNTWIANHEGSTLVIPIGDLAQHTLSAILYYTVNHFPIFDDIAVLLRRHVVTSSNGPRRMVVSWYR